MYFIFHEYLTRILRRSRALQKLLFKDLLQCTLKHHLQTWLWENPRKTSLLHFQNERYELLQYATVVRGKKKNTVNWEQLNGKVISKLVWAAPYGISRGFLIWSLLGVQPTLQSLACWAGECKQGIPITHPAQMCKSTPRKHTQTHFSHTREYTTACVNIKKRTQSCTRHYSTHCAHVTLSMFNCSLSEP